MRRELALASALLAIPLGTRAPAQAESAGTTPPASAQSAGLSRALPLLGVEMLLPHLARPQPFARPLGVALRLAEGDAELTAALDGMRAIAARGTPTRPMLAGDFAAAADLAIMAEAGLEGGGMIARLAATTMRLGASLGSSATPTLAATRTASARLAEGDLARAEAVISTLDGAPAAALAPWRAAAQDRLSADAAAATLMALVAARLTVAR